MSGYDCSLRLYLTSTKKKCLEGAGDEGTLVITHDDDLQIIKSKELVRPKKNAEFRATSYINARTKETLTADAVLRFLHENKTPVLIENGGMLPVSYKEFGRG